MDSKIWDKFDRMYRNSDRSISGRQCNGLQYQLHCSATGDRSVIHPL
ncbi:MULTISPECIES: hypothetical protein [unclassified Anabaena]|nr:MULTISPECIES: hypothetical protein [unclassified Anabaena]